MKPNIAICTVAGIATAALAVAAGQAGAATPWAVGVTTSKSGGAQATSAPIAPATVMATSVSSSGMTINVTAAPASGPTPTAYVVNETSPNTVSNVCTMTATNGLGSCSVTGLQAGISYTFIVFSQLGTNSATVWLSATGAPITKSTTTTTLEALDLYSEVQLYNSSHPSSNSSNGAGDFTFYQGAKDNQGSTISWTSSVLTNSPMTYTASTATNGKWSTTNAGPIGPIATSPFNGISVIPGATNKGGQQGYPAVTKLTVPSAPSGNYKSGSTIRVRAVWTAGTGMSDYVYLLDSSGSLVSGTTGVQVNSGVAMDTTFSIPTPSASAVYYVAVAPESAGTSAATVTLDVTASLPYA